MAMRFLALPKSLHASKGTRLLSISSALQFSSCGVVKSGHPTYKLIHGSAFVSAATNRSLSGPLEKIRSDLVPKKVNIQIHSSSQPSLILHESVLLRFARAVQEHGQDSYSKVNELLEDFSQKVIRMIKTTGHVMKVSIGTTAFFVTVTAVGTDLYLSPFSYIPPGDPSS